MKYKIIQEHAKCISCGACIAACPSNWEWDKDGKAKMKKAEITDKDFACNKKSADACPVHIIHIKKA